MRRNYVDYDFYYLGQGDLLVVLMVYVDDVILMNNDIARIHKLKQTLGFHFQVCHCQDLWPLCGCGIHQNQDGMLLTEQNHAFKSLKELELSDCNPRSVPLLDGTCLETKMHQPLVDVTQY